MGAKEINLYLSDIKAISPLKIQIFKDELKEINNKFSITENTVDIVETYSTIKNEKLEMGFFIRNAFSHSISLELMNIAILNDKGKVILVEKVNFKSIGTIPSYSAIPSSLTFEVSEKIISNKHEKFKIKFLNEENIHVFKSVESNLENLPIDMSFEEENKVLQFFKGLKTLHKDEISVSTFEKMLTEDGGVEISMIFRNGYSKVATLSSFPVKIINFNNVVICDTVIEDPDGLVKIFPGKAKLVKFKIDKSKIYNTVFDLDRCKILFQ